MFTTLVITLCVCVFSVVVADTVKLESVQDTNTRHTQPIFGRRAVCDSTSYYDCGLAVGSQMTEIINDYFTQTESILAIKKWIESAKGTLILNNYLKAHKSLVPHLVEECEGIAAGSGLPFNWVFAVNLQSELVWHMNQNQSNDQKIKVPKSCTDYHLSFPDEALWAHNEDGPDSIKNSTYLVYSNITLPGKQPFAYVAFTYPGQLSGWAWGFNSKGLVQSINALEIQPPSLGSLEDNVDSYGIGVNFLARDILDSSSLSQAVKKAKTVKNAGGQHFNLGSIHTDRPEDYDSPYYSGCVAGTPCQLSLEVSPEDVSVQVINTVPGGRYSHMNLYLHDDEKPRLGDYESSVHRLARASQYSTGKNPPKTGPDVLIVLGDMLDEDFPIYRTGTTKDDDFTLTTTLFDLNRKIVLGFDVRPTKDGEPQFMMPLGQDF